MNFKTNQAAESNRFGRGLVDRKTGTGDEFATKGVAFVFFFLIDLQRDVKRSIIIYNLEL